MKYLSIQFLFFILFLNYKQMISQDSTLIGKALDAKAGAILVTKQGSVYYLQSIDYWDSSIKGKTIKVVGFLKKVNIENKIIQKNEIPEQKIGGDYMIIINPKWELLLKKRKKRKELVNSLSHISALLDVKV